MKTGKPKNHNHDLKMRFLVNGISSVLIALIFIFAQLPYLRWLFVSAVAAIGSVAVWEYDQIVKKKGLFPAVGLSVLAVFCYVWAIFLKGELQSDGERFLFNRLPEMILGLAFFGCFVHYILVGRPPIANISVTFFGILYVGVPMGVFIWVMYFFEWQVSFLSRFEGVWWIIYLILVSKSADIGGYFVGRYFGKHKLALKLSPNKTLEGALGGLAASMGISLLLAYVGKSFGGVFFPFSYTSSLILGAVIGILGQIGDLAESFLKRDAGVKDSNTLPGVGGILDMVDSLLFTAPILYIFLGFLYNGSQTL